MSETPLSAKEWLAYLGSAVAARIPGQRAHLAPMAAILAKSVPASWLLASVADKVAETLPERAQMPDLLRLVRREAEMMPGQNLKRQADEDAEARAIRVLLATLNDRLDKEGPGYLPHLISFARSMNKEAAKQFIAQHVQGGLVAWWEDQDRTWWMDRVADIRSRPHAGVRWRDASEMLAQLSHAAAFPRPWLVPILVDIINEAEDAGADTTFPIRPARTTLEKIS